jgi:hypothetical protein
MPKTLIVVLAAVAATPVAFVDGAHASPSNGATHYEDSGCVTVGEYTSCFKASTVTHSVTTSAGTVRSLGITRFSFTRTGPLTVESGSSTYKFSYLLKDGESQVERIQDKSAYEDPAGHACKYSRTWLFANGELRVSQSAYHCAPPLF